MRPTAVVTGASRGIGKASAIALAAAGFDVAITARTVHRGTTADDATAAGEPGVAGSLEETADEVEAAGGTAHLVPMDLLDLRSVRAATDAVLESLGHVDVLVNNAIHVSPKGRTRFLDIDLGDFERRLLGNVTAQVHFTKPIVAEMVDRSAGVVLNVTSVAGYGKPFAPADAGGWNFAYSVSKGGFHRIAPQIQFEYGDAGVHARNVQPGFVATERVTQQRGAVAAIADIGVAPRVIGAAVAHVATHVEDYEPYATIQLQSVAADLGLIEAPVTWQ